MFTVSLLLLKNRMRISYLVYNDLSLSLSLSLSLFRRTLLLLLYTGTVLSGGRSIPYVSSQATWNGETFDLDYYLSVVQDLLI